MKKAISVVIASTILLTAAFFVTTSSNTQLGKTASTHFQIAGKAEFG
ncbi:hypothetical protein [Bacillus paralicheniformis]|nr:hypothetical protein [Bacillus paralicheniformis]